MKLFGEIIVQEILIPQIVISNSFLVSKYKKNWSLGLFPFLYDYSSQFSLFLVSNFLSCNLLICLVSIQIIDQYLIKCLIGVIYGSLLDAPNSSRYPNLIYLGIFLIDEKVRFFIQSFLYCVYTFFF
jgi:hypothetical protein